MVFFKEVGKEINAFLMGFIIKGKEKIIFFKISFWKLKISFIFNIFCKNVFKKEEGEKIKRR